MLGLLMGAMQVAQLSGVPGALDSCSLEELRGIEARLEAGQRMVSG